VNIESESRRRVETELDRLESTYGTFRCHEDEWAAPTEQYEAVRERFEAGVVGFAGVWMTNEDGEVLLVSDIGREGWSEPVGKQEPGERLEETALREVREETGVDCRLDGVALVHVLRVRDADRPSRPTVVQMVVAFDGSYLGGTPRATDERIQEVRWWSEHPESLIYDGLAELDIPAGDE
jgi:ADP-ribose pyrophosphatase YjhB (NUDIX family)